MRVLVVEDEPQLLRALSIHLRACRYEVHVAASGGEALQVAAACLPDRHSRPRPARHGRHRRDPRACAAGRACPIIVLSGRDRQRATRCEALDAGADDYVHQAVRDGRAAGPAARRDDAPGGRRRRQQPIVHDRRLHGRPRRQAGARPPTAADVRLDPDRVAPAGGARPAPRQAASRQRQLLHEVWGPGYETDAGQPARLHGPAAPQARTRPVPPPPPAHRARHGLPIRALAGREPQRKEYGHG